MLDIKIMNGFGNLIGYNDEGNGVFTRTINESHVYNQNLVFDSDYPGYINFNQENMRNYIRLKTELNDIIDNHLQKFNLNEFVDF